RWIFIWPIFKVKTMELEVRNTTIPTNILEHWQKVVDAISDILSVPSAMINRIDPPDLEIFCSNISPDNPFPSGTRMKMAGVYCETTAKKRQMVQVVDARKDPLWADSPTVEAGIFAYMGYPLLWPDGEVFGTLCVVDTKSNKWGKRHENLLLTFKDVVEDHLSLVNTIEQLDQKNQELQRALSEVKTLRGLLPICASCKNIRDDKGYWNKIESYIIDRSEAEFSHSICPECAKKLYPGLEIYDNEK
ncbi:GAF domain-containing protein, partial [Thermodesulfobacteriota bacterium]